MESMKSFARLFYVVLGLTGFAVLAFVAVNFGDESLSPELKALIEAPPRQVTDAERLGFQYFLGFQVSPNEDPAAKGSEIYDRLKAGLKEEPLEQKLLIDVPEEILRTAGFIGRPQFEAAKSVLEVSVMKNKLTISRFETLIGKGGMASDLKPQINLPLALNMMTRAFRLKLAQLNLLLRQGKFAKVADDLEAINRFFASAFRQEAPLLHYMIFGSFLKSIREFYRDAAPEFPKFAGQFSKTRRSKMHLQVNVDEILNHARNYELKALNDAFQKPVTAEMFYLSGIEPHLSAVHNRWRDRTINLFMPLLFKPNRTLNQYFLRYNQQIADLARKIAQTPRPKFALRNPLGNILIEILLGSVGQRTARLKLQISELAQPI